MSLTAAIESPGPRLYHEPAPASGTRAARAGRKKGEIHALMADGDASAARVPEGFLAGEPEVHDAVRSWIAPIVRSGSWRFSDPEGVVQEVLVKLLAILREGRFRRRSSFRTFVHSVTRHTCIDVYRRENYRAGFEAEEAADETSPSGRPDPERILRTRERFERIRYIIQRLPEDCRSLWRLIYGEGRTPSEVARDLGITAGNARVKLHRCLQKARVLGAEFLSLPVT